MKKIFFLSITILLMTMSLYSQYGLRVYNFQPLGKDGVIFKPTVTAEIGYMEPFDERFRKTAFFSIINLKTTIPEIPMTGKITDDGKVTIVPGYQIFDLYMMIQFRAGYDYALIKNEKFNTFIGANVIFGASIIDYEDDVELIGGIDLFALAPAVGAQLRAGMDYQFSESFGAFITINHDLYFSYNEYISHAIWANEFGLGVTYNF